MGSNLPNLMAEIQYSGVGIVTLAEHAGVSQEIMQNILNGEDSLALDEAMRLAALFQGYSIPDDIFDLDYLFFQQLLMVDVRQMEAMDEIEQSLWRLEIEASKANTKSRYARDIKRLLQTAQNIQAQAVVPYARYRHFGHEVLLIRACLLNKERVRRTKLSEA